MVKSVSVLVCFVLSAVLLAAFLTPVVRSANPQPRDVLTQILGGTAEVAAEAAYQQADVYFHSGVRKSERSDDEDTSRQNHSSSNNSGLPLKDLILLLQNTTKPSSERHVASSDEKEILPWFVVAVRLNPHHIEAWCVGTYWFYRTKEYDRAKAFITEGIRHNPKNYKLYFERGALFARLKQWDLALKDLEKADILKPEVSDEFEWHAVDAYLKYVRAKLAGDPNVKDIW